jgi:putative oxidoreductase
MESSVTTSTEESLEPSTRPRQGAATADRVLSAGETAASRFGITALRVSIGLVFLAFGVLKFFPGASPIEGLVDQTWTTLTFGAITGYTALAITATLETLIGILFITGFLMPLALVLLAVTFVGILAPLVLFPGELFPGGLPSLTAQYIIKDLVLIVGALVVAGAVAGKLRARLAARRPS